MTAKRVKGRPKAANPIKTVSKPIAKPSIKSTKSPSPVKSANPKNATKKPTTSVAPKSTPKVKTPVSKAVASAKTSSAKITKDVPEASPRVSGRARKILDYNAMAKGEEKVKVSPVKTTTTAASKKAKIELKSEVIESNSPKKNAQPPSKKKPVKKETENKSKTNGEKVVEKKSDDANVEIVEKEKPKLKRPANEMVEPEEAEQPKAKKICKVNNEISAESAVKKVATETPTRSSSRKSAPATASEPVKTVVEDEVESQMEEMFDEIQKTADEKVAKKAPQSSPSKKKNAINSVKSASSDKEEATPPSPAKNASPEKNEKPETVVATKTPVSEVIKVQLPSPSETAKAASALSSPPNSTGTVLMEVEDPLITVEQNQKCGDCPGCLRKPCNECSKCKNGEKSMCIDTYCMNTDEGRRQREAAKAKYLESLTKAKLNSGGTFKPNSLDFTPNKNLTIKEQVDMIMSQLHSKQQKRVENVKAEMISGSRTVNNSTPKSTGTIVNSSNTVTTTTTQPRKVEPKSEEDSTPGSTIKKPRAKHRMINAYGSSGKAAKTRRCGECEGCMRDDCGNCSACADKPRFGGRGTKKKACSARICRMRGPPADGRAIVVQQDQDGQTYQIVGYISSDD